MSELSEFIADVRGRVPINEFDLIDECKKQPAFFEEVSSEVGRFKSLAKKAKAKVEFTKAKLTLDIRKDPEKFSIVGKLTETTIDATAIVQPSYQDALREQYKAEKDADSLQSLVFVLEQRKSMIRDLVSLNNHDYRNSEPVIPRSSKVDGDRRADEITNIRRRKVADDSDG